jgi:hypothetical protein
LYDVDVSKNNSPRNDRDSPMAAVLSNSSREIGNLAKSSPREVVQAAVSSYCEDAFALAEQIVHRRRSSPRPLNSPRPAPSASDTPAATTPREAISKVVSSFCEDTIASAEAEAIRVLSPRPLDVKDAAASSSNKKIISPKRASRSDSVPDEKSKQRTKGKGSNSQKKPPQQQQQQQPQASRQLSEADLSSDSFLQGEKMSRIPAPKKIKKKIVAPPVTIALPPSAAAEVPQTTDSSVLSTPALKDSNKKRSGKKDKKPSAATGAGAVAAVEKKPKKLSPSPSRDSIVFPPINRPAPPTGERNASQHENPRNRKLSSKRSSSKDDGSESSGTEVKEKRAAPLPQVSGSFAGREKQQSKSVPNDRVISEHEEGARGAGGLLIHREQSKSVQMAGGEEMVSLPPITGLRRSETTPRHKKRKKPLFLRLEDKAKKLQMDIEKEKV